MTAQIPSWKEHVFQKGVWDARDQSKWILLIAGFLVLLAGVIYVLQIAQVASMRHQLDEMLARQDSLERENELLISAVSEAKNLESLQARATQLGFQRARFEDIRYLQSPDFQEETNLTLAKQERATDRIQPERLIVTPITADRGWLGDFHRQWREFTRP